MALTFDLRTIVLLIIHDIDELQDNEVFQSFVLFPSYERHEQTDGRTDKVQSVIQHYRGSDGAS